MCDSKPTDKPAPEPWCHEWTDPVVGGTWRAGRIKAASTPDKVLAGPSQEGAAESDAAPDASASVLTCRVDTSDVQKELSRLSEERDERAAWLAAWVIEKWNGTDDLPGWVRKSAQCWTDLQNENALLREQIHCLESAVEYWRAGREAHPDE